MPDASRFIVEQESSEPDIERWLRLIPFIGAPIANILQGIRSRPIVAAVEAELLRRRRPGLDVWGESRAKALFAQSVCEVAMLEMGWPNDHFLPNDPVAVVFWNHRDNLDFATAVKDLELNLNTRLSEFDVTTWFDKSLAEVIDVLWASQSTDPLDPSSWPPPPTVDPAVTES